LSVDLLKEDIGRNDEVGFLRRYLTLILEGEGSFDVPTSEDLHEIETVWRDILVSISGTYLDGFLSDLVSVWVKLLQTQEEGTLESVVKGMLLELDANDEGGDSKSDFDETKKRLPKVAEKKDVVVQLSKAYKKDVEASAFEFISDSKRRIDLQSASESEEPDLFLIHYLALCRTGKMPLLPRSTELNKIGSEWRRILGQDMPTVADPFITALSSRWFFYVHRVMMPISLPQCKTMLQYILTHKNNPVDTGGLSQMGDLTI
jgi:hypothetical protein